jgi:parallel beta-helix repeat protein
MFVNSSGSAINNELLNYEEDGIWIFNSSYVEIASNSITGGVTGISILNSNDIDVRNNSLSGGPHIWAYNLLFCSFASNRILDSETEGIWLHSLDSCSVSNNEILNCTDDGIHVYYSSDVDLRLNSIADSGGICLGYSNEIEVSDNKLVRGWGVILDNLEDCSVTNNEILFVREAGIWDYQSNDLMINQNVIQFAEDYGIFTEGSINCAYTANRISRSRTGIHILSTHSSIFSYNHLVDNLEYGITILYGSSNSLYGNLLGGLSSAQDDGNDNVWDDGDRIGNYWSDVSSLFPVSIEGVAHSSDRYPLLLLPPDLRKPTITCPPIISPDSQYSAILTWVIWSSPGSYVVYHNEQQHEAGVWYQSGSLGVWTNVLANGNHTFSLVVTDDESRTTTSTVFIRMPGFESLNDADADGMRDMWELEYGFQPMDGSDANEDADSDGLVNLEEHDLGTDPYSTDSDEDSIPDIWEVRNGFDPLNPEIPLFEYISYFHPYIFFTPLGIIPLLGTVVLYRRIPNEKRPRFLRGRTLSKSFWLKLIIAFGILLIFPTTLYIRESYMTELDNRIDIRSIFMTFEQSGLENPTLSFITLSTLTNAIIMTLPAIYLNRKLRDSPANESILDMSLAAVFGTIVFAQYIVGPPDLYNTWWYSYSSLELRLLSFSTLVIFGLILVPIFSREAAIWGREKVIEAKSAAKSRFHRINKYSIGGSLWCLAVSVLPVVGIVEIHEQGTYSQFISPSFLFQYNREDAAIPGDLGGWMRIYWDIPPISDFMIFLTLGAFQLIFAFHVLRYFRDITSRKRVMQLGILAIFVPFIYCLITASNPNIVPFTVAIPLPFVSLLGLFALIFITPNDPSIERNGELEYPETPLEDLRIQVPIIYYIKSRLMSLLRKSSRSEGE